MVKIRRALISVSDKTDLDWFVKGLDKLGIEVISTGGTAKFIESLGVKTTSVSDVTGFPEMLDGRVKTLHPKIHGGLLALRDNPEHVKQLKEHNIEFIDMVVVNLYPFEKTTAKKDIKLEEAIENIDIGGPSMLRSAAKNYRSVAVICNTSRYRQILDELQKNNSSLSEKTLTDLAVEVFGRTKDYDKAIYEYLKKVLRVACPGFRDVQARESLGFSEEKFPDELNLKFTKLQDLRYGENPHQNAAFYKDVNFKPNEANIAGARQLHGKELSFNNILDLNAALEIVREFKEPAASIIKHNTPCGAACGNTLVKAYKDALECDKLSAFGSVVGLNRQVDIKTAKAITGGNFVECIIAPGYDKDALDILKAKKNLRLLEVGNFESGKLLPDIDLKKVSGGILVQDKDIKDMAQQDLKVVTNKKPTKGQIKSLLFGWKVVKHVKSNAIVLVKDTRTIGIGAGQMSRVDACFIAIKKAGKKTSGCCLASDAFFPKPDSIQLAKRAKIKAIIQPGGSIQDKEIIDQANKSGIAMVFTGMRHFRH